LGATSGEKCIAPVKVVILAQRLLLPREELIAVKQTYVSERDGVVAVNDTIRLGIIGAGNIGNVHMRVFSQIPEASIVGVTDVYQPLAEERAKTYGIDKVYATAENLIDDERIDAVVIGVPNKYHAPLAIKALEAGKHVVVEKPMAFDVDSARAIVRAQRASGKVLMVPHQMRWGWTARQV